jgi:Glyoxalase-like domain
MSAITMAGLLVEAAEPPQVARFWAGVLGGEIHPLLDGSVQVRGDFPDLTFYAQARAKSVKNRVHFDLSVPALEPLLALGARVLAEYPPARVTLADVEGNEFCAFLARQARDSPPARVFALCTDSDRPEELAAWWAPLVSARIDAGTDGTPRWLHGPAGWPGITWKFIRVADPRVVPNRWRWTVRGDPRRVIAAGATVAEAGVLLDPQGNQFSVTE